MDQDPVTCCLRTRYFLVSEKVLIRDPYLPPKPENMKNRILNFFINNREVDMDP